MVIMGVPTFLSRIFPQTSHELAPTAGWDLGLGNRRTAVDPLGTGPGQVHRSQPDSGNPYDRATHAHVGPGLR